MNNCIVVSSTEECLRNIAMKCEMLIIFILSDGWRNERMIITT